MGSNHSAFKTVWETALQDKPYPQWLRNVIRIDAKEFVDYVAAATDKDATDLVNSIMAGDAYILKNAHTSQAIDALRERIFSWRSERSPDNTQKIIEGCSDYHAVNSIPREGKEYYQTIERTHGFFRWNGDPLDIFSMLDPYWGAIKELSGHGVDAFITATPRDGTIDKLAVYQYPMSFGRVSKHFDPPADQKLLLNLPMGMIGRDYGFGPYGFYAIDGDSGKRIYLEHMMNFGDYVCICPTVHHGADPVQPVSSVPDSTPEWESSRGRWLLTAISVPSHEVESRVSTVAVNN